MTVGGLVTIFSPDLPSLQGGGSSDSPLKIFQSYIIIVIVTITTLYRTSAKILCKSQSKKLRPDYPGLGVLVWLLLSFEKTTIDIIIIIFVNSTISMKMIMLIVVIFIMT